MNRARIGLFLAGMLAIEMNAAAQAGKPAGSSPAAERRLSREGAPVPSAAVSSVAGAVRVPAAIKAGDRVLPRGSYEVRLTRDAQGAWVELWKDGAIAARELAVKPIKQPARSGHGRWASLDRRDESFVRVYCQEGRELYVAVFESAA